jgi:hypothetical protein
MSEGGGRLCRSVSLLTTTTCIIVEGQGCSSFLFVVFNPLSVRLVAALLGWIFYLGCFLWRLLRLATLHAALAERLDLRGRESYFGRAGPGLEEKKTRQDKTEQETV